VDNNVSKISDLSSFCLQDCMEVQLRLAKQTEIDNQSLQIPVDPTDDGTSHELANLTNHAQTILSSLRTEIPGLVAYLELLEQRIALLSRKLANKDSKKVVELIPVSISEAGISFLWPESINPREWVRIQLVLRPSYESIQSMARVMSCVPQAGVYEINLKFTCMSPANRGTLNRHIFKVQAQRRSAQIC